MPPELAIRSTNESAATTAAYTAWCAVWDGETEHRFECPSCPLIGFPVCSAGEQLVIKRVICGEALRRARLADERAA